MISLPVETIVPETEGMSDFVRVGLPTDARAFIKSENRIVPIAIERIQVSHTADPIAEAIGWLCVNDPDTVRPVAAKRFCQRCNTGVFGRYVDVERRKVFSDCLELKLNFDQFCIAEVVRIPVPIKSRKPDIVRPSIAAGMVPVVVKVDRSVRIRIGLQLERIGERIRRFGIRITQRQRSIDVRWKVGGKNLPCFKQLVL